MPANPLDRAQWRKSSRSQGANACVEVALTHDAVGVRDTKNRTAGYVAISPAEWSAFVDHLKGGAFDL